MITLTLEEQGLVRFKVDSRVTEKDLPTSVLNQLAMEAEAARKAKERDAVGNRLHSLKLVQYPVPWMVNGLPHFIYTFISQRRLFIMDRTRARKSLIGEECPNQTWTDERYPDPGDPGKWNYGVGHHEDTAITLRAYNEIQPRPEDLPGNPILIPDGTESIGDYATHLILEYDIDNAADDVIYWLSYDNHDGQQIWGSLTNVRREALMQMAFQLGRSSLLGFEDTRQEIWDEDWAGAAREMRSSLWYEQTEDRCKRMATAFENNDASGWRQAVDPYDGG